MQYLIQPRGPGTGWVFRMVTPLELVGTPNPWTGKPFGKEIKKGLKTRRITEAKARRDIALGEIRQLAFSKTDAGQFTLGNAEEWRDIIRDDQSGEQDAASVLSDKLEAAEMRGVPEAKLKTFGRVAFGKGYPINKALEQYIEERRPNNRRGYAPLKTTTVNNLRTAVKHLGNFLGDSDGVACLEDVTPALARRFRDDYLPELRGPRSPQGMAHKTVAKNITLLTSFWAWAIERQITHHRYKSPWVFPKAISRSSRLDQPTRQIYDPLQVNRLFSGTAPGTKEGDLVRLALVTGCRADEIAMLLKADVERDGSFITVREGKTANASRRVPIPNDARPLVQARLRSTSDSDRFFPEWPIRESVGKVYALSQWFTRYRRKQLGPETDGHLSLHSFRHTWRTVGRRARVPDPDMNDIGGWAGPKTSNAVYDHGLLEDQLMDAQEQIWQELMREGYLDVF